MISVNKLATEIPDSMPTAGSLCSVGLTDAQYHEFEDLSNGTRDGKYLTVDAGKYCVVIPIDLKHVLNVCHMLDKWHIYS